MLQLEKNITIRKSRTQQHIVEDNKIEQIVAVTCINFSILVDCFIHYFTICFKQARTINISPRLIIH